MVEMGRELLARIHEIYFGSLEEEAMKNLKLAMETVETEFEGGRNGGVGGGGRGVICDGECGRGVGEGGGKEGWVMNPNDKSQMTNDKTKVLSSWAKDQETIVFGNGRF